MALRALAILAASASPALADFDAEAFPPYERCALCHGLFGASHIGKFPHLAGQKPAYLRAQIDAFLSGTRRNDNGQMASIVTELKPEDIPVVVAWFSSQEPPQAQGEGSVAGKELFAAFDCAGCHDATNAVVPHLTAQHAAYLVKQMTDIRDGRRDVSEHSGTSSMTDDDISAIAAYLAAERRP